MSKKVLVPLAEGFEEVEAVTITDILRRANIEVITASLTDNLEVKGSHNIILKADTALDKVINEEFDFYDFDFMNEVIEEFEKNNGDVLVYKNKVYEIPHINHYKRILKDRNK